MISVEEAQKLVTQHTTTNLIVEIPLAEALGKVLAADVVAPLNLPSFAQSAMDGYAIKFDDTKRLKVVTEIPAGTFPSEGITYRQAARIFTGAAIPNGADAIIIQEKVVREEKDGQVFIHIQGEMPKQGMHIRTVGAQVKKGNLALAKGHTINAATIGFLAMLGFNKVKVYQTPSIAIVNTGNELVAPGKPLAPGQVYESNSFALKAALQKMGLSKTSTHFLKDDYEATFKTLKSVIQQHQITIITGGISVGDYDFVGKALPELQVQQLFYKVAQKPGKPLYFGKLNGQLVFALPGNPASALVCFYQYVLPAIRKMLGYAPNNLFLPQQQLPIAHALNKPFPRACFYRAKIENQQVHSLEGQASFIMQSFAQANALLYLSAEQKGVDEGELVTVYLLD